MKFHLLILPDGKLGMPLPSIIKLQNPLPNEPACMRKRMSPKALRYYKAKNDRDPSRFYLHELMLYKSFNREIFSSWCSDEKVCTKEYLTQTDNIQKVKGLVMEWIQNVEEARMYVEETLNNEVNTDETGNEVDAEKEHDILECLDQGDEDDPQYQHLNPDGLIENPFPNYFGNRICKQIQLKESEVLERKTKSLDKNQRKVQDIAIKYARDTVKACKNPNRAPEAPKLIVTGGAGAGKSTVINVVTQWIHKI